MTLAAQPPAEDPTPRARYGARPVFASRRWERDRTPVAELFELLPREQAEARRRRWERAGRNAVVADRDDVLSEETFADTHWSWEEWCALKVGRLEGPRFEAILSTVRQALEAAEVNPDPLVTTEGGELLVPEDAGIRLALCFVGVKPLKRYDRMRALGRGLARMSTEECYYWHALCRSPSSPNGAKALRTLLTSHVQ